MVLCLIIFHFLFIPKILWALPTNHSIKRTLWIDPSEINLSRPQVVRQILSQPVDRIIISCFTDGQSLFASNSSEVNQMRMYKGRKDVLNPLIKVAHQHNIKVYAFVNCLEWKHPGSTLTADILNQHMNLAEVNLSGGCGSLPGSKYASPFHPLVRQVLADIVAEVAKQYPNIDGILLQCRLPLETLLGYSDVARATYIISQHIDPADIPNPLFSAGTEDTMLYQEWKDWRIAQMMSLVKRLSHIFKNIHPSGHVAVTGYANWSSFTKIQQNSVLEDWPSWVASGFADEVILEEASPYSSTQFYSPNFPNLTLSTSTSMALLLPLRENTHLVDPIKVLEGLENQNVRSLVLRVTTQSDLTRAMNFWTNDLPEIAPALQQ